MHMRTPADGTDLQILGNAVTQIEVEVAHCQGALREVRKELEFLKDEGAVERLAQTKLAVGHRAVRLAAIMPGLQAVLEEVREVAGSEAVSRASAPVHFQR